MRYRTKLGGLRVATWLAYGVAVTADLLGRRFAVWLAVPAGVLTVLLFLPGYFLSYWEVLPDRLIEQHIFRRTVFLFVEIIDMQPRTAAASEEEELPERVEIQAVRGRSMVVETEEVQAFLDEMLEHLPATPQ
jgi:hypothetical protein